MEAIIIKGAQSAGKTVTINLIYCRLKSLGASESQSRVPVKSNPFDFECILQYTNTNNKHVSIAFFSMGDYKRYIRKALKTYSKCDYLIIANRDDRDDIDDEIKKACDTNAVLIEPINNIKESSGIAAKIAQIFETMN